MKRHAIHSPAFRREDDRGELLEILDQGSWTSLLSGRMKPGSVMGNHYHKITNIFFFLTRGSAQVSTVHAQTGERDRFRLEPRQGVMLEPGESHAIRFLEESEFIMLKSRRYDPADPDTFPLEAE
jgi:dTDP-4-dehydrorhamnose 3,5-epimerase-like enzyme